MGNSPPNTTEVNVLAKDRIVAKVVNAGKEYVVGDTKITALKASTVELKAGELLLIIGPSGSGKTTLLSLFGCVLYPSFGEVWIDAVQVNELSESKLAALRLLKIGFIFQRFNLIAPLTALENVMMPLLLQDSSEREAKLKATAALEKVGMGDRMKNLSNDLSGGQQQRVAIARALVTNPEMMLCDEPTASLDLASAGIVMRELKDLAKQGKAVAVVTHDARLRPFADRIVYVLDGSVSDTPVEEELAIK
ncbi:ABC transporter ATP-binding protein [Flavobacterium sp.]|uniref:ABC transporter ATP-binding protein n=1 Tax=Flavobacterium sp. TaxID=239 RepID=UPI0026131824|nr:ABC transporter ATP-binding protein [Flavobacterium sp.]